jgi:hypothetical protein
MMSQNVSHLTLSPRGVESAAATHEDQSLSPQFRDERRQGNPTLRKLVDGLLDHVRELYHSVDQMSPAELEDAKQRFMWIAELTWATITDEKNRPAFGR